MMKNYGILSPSSERDDRSIEGFFFLDEEPNDDTKASLLEQSKTNDVEEMEGSEGKIKGYLGPLTSQ